MLGAWWYRILARLELTKIGCLSGLLLLGACSETAIWLHEPTRQPLILPVCSTFCTLCSRRFLSKGSELGVMNQRLSRLWEAEVFMQICDGHTLQQQDEQR